MGIISLGMLKDEEVILQADGYEFVPISELLLEGETTIDVNGTQKPAA